MGHPIRKMIERRKRGVSCAIPSYCSANSLVMEAVMEEAARQDDIVLIEATANQVNQYGGYTGLQAAEFAAYVRGLAEKTGFDPERLILGGDHLGPLVWCGEPEAAAMLKAAELVRSFVRAGFTKIHLDTSMRLGDDPAVLPPEKIAERGVLLYLACEEEYRRYLAEHPGAEAPVYVIGSEVPVPGGGKEAEETLRVTSGEDLEETIRAYDAAFQRQGITDAWEHIAAVVVQPGVEFSDAGIFLYDRGKARELSLTARKYPELVLEGHSTDYQGPRQLREMVEDGFGILKVGPALTFALREAMFSLHSMEKELLPEGKRDSDLINVLETAMRKRPENWKAHYHGNERQLRLARKYSFSDRCRYYLGDREVSEAMERLFQNLQGIQIPMNLLCQYMPVQYKRVRDGILKKEARELAKDAVREVVRDYEYAARGNFCTQYR